MKEGAAIPSTIATSSPASHLPSNVLAARGRLAAGYERLKAQHEDGCCGVDLCALLTELRDQVVLELFQSALGELSAPHGDMLGSEVALVALGGYARRELAPWSDVDLMLLHLPAAADRAAPLAKRLWRDYVDVGLSVGHSVRTPDQAAYLASSDPAIAASLVDARHLAGSMSLFARFSDTFRRHVRRQSPRLITAVVRQRAKECARYGETVYLLEPNVKRSRGALRDLQLFRWVGLMRYGTPELAGLKALGVLSEEGLVLLDEAREFLLHLRNEMHFHAARAADILDQSEQLRIAERFGYSPAAGLRPVEQFMQDYFRHTTQVNDIATRFVAIAGGRGRLNRLLTSVLGRQIDRALGVGLDGSAAGQGGPEEGRGNLTAILRMAEVANLYGRPISPETWEVVRRIVPRLPAEPPPEACQRFLALLDHSTQLGPLLHELHGAGVLERFLPALVRTRGLLEFGQYHKYTVDEHCLRAVDFAAHLMLDTSPLGQAYSAIRSKRVLHLALLLHDLGKGLARDHCEAGLDLATEAAERLGLSHHETELLRFLVHKHLLMSHLAFRRDTSEQQLILQFVREVGSPEILRMLFVLTAADLAAVGPGVWDDWKAQILTELFRRAMHHLAGDSPGAISGDELRGRRKAALAALETERDNPWFIAQLDALPQDCLAATDPRELATDLHILYHLEPAGVVACGRYAPETNTVRYTVYTHEETAPGVFHKLTGALARHGLQIRSAQINTLAKGFVLDHFWVYDPDSPGEPSPVRIEQINAALVHSLSPGCEPPSFSRRRRVDRHALRAIHDSPTRVSIDNDTSDRYTILDVFARDRLGLLYTISRTLFTWGLSVWRAMVATYGDQVVDVFYTTDQFGRKIDDEERVEDLQRRLLKAIDLVEEE